MNRGVIVSLIGIVVLPVSFLSQRNMAWTSSAVVAVNVYIFMLLARLYEADPAPAGICILGFSRGNIAMVSAMMQAVIIQMCVLPMYGQLEGRSPRKFQGVLVTSFSVLFAIFAGFSAIAYMTFGPGVHGNVLVDLPHNLFGNLARFAASASVLGVFPLILMPMIAPIQNYSGFQKEDQQGSGLSRDFVTTLSRLMVIAAVMVATFYIHDLGFMNVVNGAMCVGGIVAMCPALVGLWLVEREHVLLWRLAMVALLVFGILMSILGLVYTDNYAELLKGNCLWSL